MTDVPRIKVLLVEDHTVTRLGIRFVIENASHLEFVGEAINGAEAIKQAQALLPDVVVMDLEMPVMDGIAAAKEVRKKHPEMKILMLTGHRDEQQIFAALAAGANGYCVKDVTDDRLVTAIETVYAGDVWLDATIAAKVIKALPQSGDRSSGAGSDELSEREMDVLKLIVEGLANAQIAQRLFISNDTVKTHIKHILEKLSVTDRTQAAVKALRQGLL